MTWLARLAVLCACGCPRSVHRHNNWGRYCGRHQGCRKWRPRLRRVRLGPLTPEDLRLLSQPVT